jgi:hypothetical protein
MKREGERGVIPGDHDLQQLPADGFGSAGVRIFDAKMREQGSSPFHFFIFLFCYFYLFL